MTKKHLFMLSIGPVQSFISQSRKTKDLFGASKLLADLVEKAAQTLLDNGGLLIFPTEVTAIAKSNRVLGYFENIDSSLPLIGQQIEMAIREAFWSLSQKYLPRNASKEVEAVYHNQLKDFLEIYWFFSHPLEENGTNNILYKDEYKKMLTMLTNVKRERFFVQNTQTGRKCLLDGENNALFVNIDKRSELPATFRNQTIHTFKHHDFKKKEAVSAISFLKRSHGGDKLYPSTAKICLMTTLNDGRIKKYLNELKDFLGNDYDERLLYWENCNPIYFEENQIEKSLAEVKSKVNTFSELCKKNALELSKYYAILVFDGDDAGKKIAGDYQYVNSLGIEYQTALSGLLNKFATEARSYVDSDNRGKTIYTGGDDFIGLINLEYLLEVMKGLRVLFSEKVSKELIDFNPNIDSFSFSAGVIIAHYNLDLSQVLTNSRKMQSLSKQFLRNRRAKNAFTIGVMRASDNHVSGVFTMPWSQDVSNCESADSITLLSDFIKRIRKIRGGSTIRTTFSNAFINNIQAEKRRYKSVLGFDTIQHFLPYYLSQSLLSKSTNHQLVIQEYEQIIHNLYRNVAQDTSINQLDAFLSCLDSLDFISTHLNPIIDSYE